MDKPQIEKANGSMWAVGKMLEGSVQKMNIVNDRLDELFAEEDSLSSEGARRAFQNFFFGGMLAEVDQEAYARIMAAWKQYKRRVVADAPLP